MECWCLTDNPRGSVYRHLIQVLCKNSDRFYFVTRKEIKYDPEPLAQFAPYIIETYRSNKFGTTITHGTAATVSVITVNKETRLLLQSLADSLYQWVGPRLPEDLTFIQNGFKWFTCTTHEEMGLFRFHSEYQKKTVEQIEGLEIGSSHVNWMIY